MEKAVYKGRDRNNPCCCGSGRKLKHCHRDRDQQVPESPWAAVEKNKKAFSEKRCFAKGSGLGACEGQIVRAHSVSKGANLNRIAENGHVLGYTTDIAKLRRNNGKIIAEKIGVQRASVFNGFCALHDRDLFSCLENEEFLGRPDQCLAIAYRTLSRELYGNEASASIPEILRGADKGRSFEEQLLLQCKLDLIKTGNSAAVREVRSTHSLLMRALEENNPGVLSSVVFDFETPLPFSFAGAWSPFFDFEGNKLQNGLVDTLLEQIFCLRVRG